MLAEGHIRTNNIKAATQLLEHHESLILDNLQIASLSCDLYLSSNKVFKCDSLVRQLKQRHGEESLKDAQTLLATSPEKLDYLNLNIDLFIRLEYFDQANVLLKKVLQQDPDNLAGLIHQRRIRFAFADLQGASASIQKVLTIDKAKFSALLLSGQILVKQNRLDDAINQLIAAKTVDANSASPRELLVSIYKQQGRLESAINEINQLIKLRSSESEYIHEKAKLYLALNQTEKSKSPLDLLSFQCTENL